MQINTRQIAESFDTRAPNYGQNEWHRRSAERLVALCPIAPGHRVLDAGTGTGFAALSAARAVGSEGHVVGVDISAGMLREANAALAAAALTNVEFVQADASHLPQYSARTFDLITCATSLLYIPVESALREWHRLLKVNGAVAFSTMQAGSLAPARIFRECVAQFGVVLEDPCDPLGSTTACRSVLEGAGFEVASVVREPIGFSDQDLALAWVSSFRSHSALYPDVRNLSEHDQLALQASFAAALARESPEALNRADMLYAIGLRQ